MIHKSLESIVTANASHAPLSGVVTRLLFAFALCIASAGVASAEDGWTLRLEPMFTQAFGHDQHVLSITTITDSSELTSAVKLDTESSIAYRHEVQYTRGSWTWGWDFLWFITSQKTPSLSGASSGSDEVVFEVPGSQYSSTDPSEMLYFRTLGDTDIAMWTFDLYGMKTLGSSDDDTFQVQFGVRFADFDNDYHSVVGIGDSGGTKIDASSNYGRMTGPLLGLSANLHRGRHSIQGYLGQSVVFGSANLSMVSSDYNGAFTEEPEPEYVSVSRFERLNEDVAIPITELRIKWTYDLSNHFGIGVGANTSYWWDVPVPPGVVPGQPQTLQENTIIVMGLFAALEVRF